MNSYPLATSSWGPEELAAIQSVVDRGMYTMGEKVREFESAFATFVGSKYCTMVNSGSSANLAAIAALFFRKEKPLQRGDEVIVPAVSWSTTYAPLQQYGLRLKFVDIDADTLNFDLTALAGAINERTRLVVAVNLLGNPNDFAAVNRLLKDRSITLVEDNCESLGAVFEGQQAGTFGEMGTFSGFFSHHISTMEGGMVVTDNEELYQILISLRAHGWTRNLPKINKVCGELSNDPFYESFRFVLPGYNLRPLEMSGAIGLQQLRKLPHFIKERRQNATIFRELFGHDRRFKIQKEIGQSSWFGFSFTIQEEMGGLTRKNLVRQLGLHGIECRPIVAGNFTKNPVIKWMDYEIYGELRNADRVHEHGLFVGNHQFDIRQQLYLLKDAIAQL